MRVPYTQAIAFMRDHGHVTHATLTRDGVIASTWIRDSHAPSNSGFVEGDVWFEETTVFDVDDDGNVDSSAVRAFLGY